MSIVGTSAASGSSRQSMVDQLRDDLLELIKSSDLKPGDKLPTESELSQTFKVARSTIREAFKHLEQAGLVNAVQGHGRFLSAIGSMSVERPITKYESITEMLESLGYVVTHAVLDVNEGVANASEAAALALQPGDPVIHLSRLRYGGDEPMVFSVGTLKRSVLPGPLAHRDWSGSISAALEAHGHRIVSSAARIRAVDLPVDAEKRFNLQGLGPWLLVEETCLTQAGERILYAEDYHRGSEIAFNMLRRR